MKLRPLRQALPRKLNDIFGVLVVAISVLMSYVFEMMVVLPDVHEIGSGCYIFIWIGGIFLMFNLIGNILACMLVDTSISATMLTPPADPILRQSWHFCDQCKALVPPRSWHCKVCNVCVLKRDHHCMFTGCCVGHQNHRYFLYFIVYLTIGTGYCTLYDSIYFWYIHGDVYGTKSTILAFILPVPLYPEVSSFYLMIYIINVIGFIRCLTLLYYHSDVIAKGAVVYQKERGEYNFGLRRNLESALGKFWYATWLSPLLSSELPHDGVAWQTLKEI